MHRARATPGENADETGARRHHRRLLYVDNLRWTMILLVISMHAADTYSPFGNWYFVERPPATALDMLVFGAWQMYLQSFFMGLLFFLAGRVRISVCEARCGQPVSRGSPTGLFSYYGVGLVKRSA